MLWSACASETPLDAGTFDIKLEHPGMAYYGCNGGELSYIFTITNMGLAVEVRNNLTKETINVTDYDGW